MGLGWVGAYGARGGAEAMAALREELMKRAIMEQQAQQQQFENQRALSADELKRQQFEQGKTEFDATLGLKRDQFGFEKQQYADGEPMRGANLRLTTAQAGRIENAPADAEAERAFAREMQGLKTQDESKLIDRRISGQLRVAQAAPRDRMVQVMGPDGVPVYMPESQAAGQPAAQAPRAVTGSERQTLAYYNRAKDASETIAPIEEQIAKAGPLSQLQLQYAPNMAQSTEQQQYRQAQRAFTEARLRKESGAAVPQQEYDNDARTYFAQPGDSPQVIEQKRKARQVVLDGLKYSSGKAYDEYYGSQGQGQAAPATSGFRVVSVR